MLVHPYLLPLIQSLGNAANPEEAVFMKKYMRHQFDFYGIKSPERKRILKDFLERQGLPEAEQIEMIVKELWDLPQREAQYAGMELLKMQVKKANEKHFELLEYCLTHKSWWDTVDYLAGHVAGSLFKTFPEKINPQVSQWMDSGNSWLQRTCLLFQLAYKKQTDAPLLFSIILELHTSKEFFIQKAIGWALRQYSKTDPDAVSGFVNQTELAPLSKREGLKWLGRKK